MVAIQPSGELQGKDEAEADIVVTVVRLVVVAIGDTAILRMIVPAAAANNAVRALWRLTTKP